MIMALEVVVRRCFLKLVFLKFHSIHRKTPVLDSPFNKVEGLEDHNFGFYFHPSQDRFCGHIRKVPWENITYIDAFVAASEFYE